MTRRERQTDRQTDRQTNKQTEQASSEGGLLEYKVVVVVVSEVHVLIGFVFVC